MRLALLFKQQFAVYVIELYLLRFYFKQERYYLPMSFLSSAFIVIALYLDNSAWFWTVTILKTMVS